VLEQFTIGGAKYLKKVETAFPGKENKEMTESDRTIHELK
jgi:hypothetical protein